MVGALNWLPVHSHNGYIDLFNELGFAGSAVFSLVMLRHLWVLVALTRVGQTDMAILHLSIALAVMAYNLAESSIMLATHSLWVLLIVSIVVKS